MPSPWRFTRGAAMIEVVEETTRGAVAEVWELATSAVAGSRWLGTPEAAGVRPGIEFRLPADQGVHGTVIGVDDEQRIVTLETTGGTTTVGFESRDDGVRLSVRPSTCAHVADERTRRAWQDALSGLALIRFQAAGRRVPRQAVVIIHGIGEQRPGSVLRGFVEGVIDDPHILSKPDDASGDYELRRLQTFKSVARPRTDFYELYWADKVRDTTKSQVVGWIKGVLLRRPDKVPRKLRALWFTTALTLGALAVTLVLLGAPQLWDRVEGWGDLAPVAFVVSAASGMVNGFLVLSVGDAARYLAARPANLAIRREIRRSGVDLMRRLHDSGDYHRVVLVGHGLGSVIGYDILRLYWNEVHNRHETPVAPRSTALMDYERVVATSDLPAEKHQLAQHELWHELRANGVPWLVTDFVTAGSPLTHAALLLASNEAELCRRMDDRELPTCPPRPDRVDGRLWFEHEYVAGGKVRTIPVLHHGAPFGPVRWTNLYFPTRLLFFGDGVGGRVWPVFGRGVLDVSVVNRQWWRTRTPKAHSSYWHRKAGAPVPREARGALIGALRLDCAKELEELAHGRPLSSFIPGAAASATDNRETLTA